MSLPRVAVGADIGATVGRGVGDAAVGRGDTVGLGVGVGVGRNVGSLQHSLYVLQHHAWHSYAAWQSVGEPHCGQVLCEGTKLLRALGQVPKRATATNNAALRIVRGTCGAAYSGAGL